MRLTDNPVFAELKAHQTDISSLSFDDVKSDTARTKAMTLKLDDLVIDLSRHLIQPDTLDLLARLADRADISGQFEKLFAGDIMNVTEQRPVLHMKARTAAALSGDEGRKLAIFSDVIRGDKSVKDVINIGIGGSDLGPAMATKALAPYHDGPTIHFVSNVDPSHLYDVLKQATPERTQFIVTSKTFTTQETMKNAELARAWLVKAGCSPDRHFAAVSAAPEKAEAWGVERDRIFGFEDGIGTLFFMVSCWLAYHDCGRHKAFL